MKWLPPTNNTRNAVQESVTAEASAGNVRGARPLGPSRPISLFARDESAVFVSAKPADGIHDGLPVRAKYWCISGCIHS